MTAEDTFTILMVAKAPQPGLAKTRLCPPLTQDQAAAVAAAALLDSLATIRQAVLGQLERIVVSWEGEAAESIAPNAIGRALDGCLVVPQRGDSFAERLVHAHEDAAEARPGNIVVQVGMDTPHLSAEQLMRAARYVTVKGNQVVLGPATDGGWWLLGLSSPLFAEALRDVSMSTAKTGLDTLSSFERRGQRVTVIEAMQDVDTWEDALSVAAFTPGSRFAASIEAVRP